jgi:3-deoxy-D-manno-octulosonate 8-phosphate phosphatase (KDO 8-P phosphatase)
MEGARTVDAFERAQKIRMIIFDVDGVLTDGGVYIGAEGELFKAFNIKDGMGIALWQRAGLKTAIITGRTSKMLEQRAAELHITEFRQGCIDKRDAYKEIKEKHSLNDEEIAYIGDDLIDLPVMLQVGLAAAPADAVVDVRDRAHFVTCKTGGHGAVREVLEFILKSQGLWRDIVNTFLS